MRMLIVEDENSLRTSLVAQFADAGFNVDQAADGEEGLYFGREYPLDLAVIDLGLPKVSGLEVIKRLRAEGKTFPILILTARDQWQDKVEGLQSGADDYVAKPFHFPEVLARAQALLRRSSGWAQSVLQGGPVALDTRSQQVTVDGRNIELTSFEYRVLEVLMHRAGEVVSKAELTERLYAQDFDRDSNTIEVFIGRLRRKLDPNETFRPIETLRGRGYRFALERKSAALAAS
jgi:two-component system response regulator PhoP